MVFDRLVQITSLFILLVMAYDMLRSLRASRISGFKFYLGSIVLQDLPVSLIALRLITAETFDPVMGFLPVLLLSIADSWVIKQQEKARQTYPTQWQVWEDRVQHVSRIDKVLLFRVIRRRVPPTSEQEAASIKAFKVITIILVVIALLSIVLLGVFLLSHRG